MINKDEIAARLRAYMENNYITQEEMAAKCGVCRQTIASALSGKPLKKQTAKQLVKVLI